MSRNIITKIVGCLIVIAYMITVFVYTYPLIGLWGQIKSIDYPKSYEKTAQFLKNASLTGHIIYLPWEGYLTYTWTAGYSSDGRISNPINNLVGPIVITSPGQWGGMNNLQNQITQCLNRQSISCLENLSVQFVLNDRCAYFPTRYEWIYKVKVHEDDCITIYRLNNRLVVDRNVHIPLRFLVGTFVSAITFISLITYLYYTSNWSKSWKRKR